MTTTQFKEDGPVDNVPMQCLTYQQMTQGMLSTMLLMPSDKQQCPLSSFLLLVANDNILWRTLCQRYFFLHQRSKKPNDEEAVTVDCESTLWIHATWLAMNWYRIMLWSRLRRLRGVFQGALLVLDIGAAHHVFPPWCGWRKEKQEYSSYSTYRVFARSRTLPNRGTVV